MPRRCCRTTSRINFQEDQAGYLAGIVAALRQQERARSAPSAAPPLCAPCVRYIQGYELGAKSVNPTSSSRPPTSTNDFSNAAFNDPVGGKTFAQQFITQNQADVLFQVAGKTGNGVLEAACAADIYGIGVDVDQAPVLPATTAKCIVTSAEKHLETRVGHGHPGRSPRARSSAGDVHFDAKNDGIGVSPAHDNAALITPDIQAKLDTALAAMKAGTLRPARQLRRAPRPSERRTTVCTARAGRPIVGRPARRFHRHRAVARADDRPGAEAGTTHPRSRCAASPSAIPGVVANDHIDLDVRPGEIHALLGENGAGKTTLMNILYGLARPDEGEILLDGQPVTIAGPSDAIARGISMVHQHFMLVPVLTVAENIVLGDETMANPVFLDRKEAEPTDPRARPSASASRSIPTPRSARCRSGWQQRVEILKALYRDARILVLDEPTAVLTPQETEEIFAVLRRLADEGHSIIFISHKLYEVLEIADRITVIRRGKVVGERRPVRDERGGPRRADGRPRGPADGRPRRVAPGRRRCSKITRPAGVKDDRGHEAVRGVDLEVRAGEILGHRRRRRQRPGRAGRGAHRAAQASRRAGSSSAGKDVTGELAARDERGRRRLRAGRPAPLRAGPVVLARRQPRPDQLLPPPYARGILRDDAAIERGGRRGHREVRHPDAVGRRCRPARCRAATSRRWSSRASSTAS